MLLLWQLRSPSSFFQGSPGIERVLVSRTIPTTNPSHPLTQVNISTSLLSTVQKDLIDSGADANFMDQQLAERLSPDFVQLERSLKAISLDGAPLWYVRHWTTPVKVPYSDGHFEFFTFLVCSTKTQPLVLGYPWIKQHNPMINWNTGEIITLSVMW